MFDKIETNSICESRQVVGYHPLKVQGQTSCRIQPISTNTHSVYPHIKKSKKKCGKIRSNVLIYGSHFSSPHKTSLIKLYTICIIIEQFYNKFNIDLQSSFSIKSKDFPFRIEARIIFFLFERILKNNAPLQIENAACMSIIILVWNCLLTYT